MFAPAFSLGVIAILTWGIGVYSFTRPEVRGTRPFGWLMTALTIWIGFYAAEMALPSIQTKILFHKISFAGQVFVPMLWLMTLGPLLPIISDFLFINGIFGVGDSTPFMFVVATPVVAIGLFRFGLFDLLPIAAPSIIESLDDVVIVVDRQNRIARLNPAARQWLKTREEIIGRDVCEILPPATNIPTRWNEVGTTTFEMNQDGFENYFDLRVIPLYNLRKEYLGRSVLIRNITREHSLLVAEKRHSRQMTLLNDITHAALLAPDLEHMLQLLADRLGELLEADGACITFWDETQQKTILKAAYGPFCESYPHMEVHPGEMTTTESALRAGYTLVITDVHHSQYLDPRIAERFPTNSMLVLPLIVGEEKLGAVLISFNQYHTFMQDEIALGEQAAGQMALAISKALLYGIEAHRSAQLAMLEEASRQVADSLDENEIYQRAIDSLVKQFGYTNATVSLLRENNDLEVVAIGGTSNLGYSIGFRQKMGEGIIGYCALTLEPYITNNIQSDSHYIYPYGDRPQGSALALPLLKGQLVGIIYAETSMPDAFGSEDVQTLQTLTTHIMLAVEKARLFASINRNLLAMATMQSVSQAITSSLDIDQILYSVLGLLRDNFHYAYISLYLLENDMLRLGAQIGYPDELIIEQIPITSGVMGRTVRTRGPQFIPDVSKEPAFLRASLDIQAEICIPLIQEDVILGVLNIEAIDNRQLGETDFNMLKTLAGSIAIAIDNARLYSKIQTLAVTDSLCQIANRRAFDEILKSEFARAKRYKHPLSLILVDVDMFKEYNDTYGHLAGDERLKATAALLSANIRKPDLVARYGGDEFAIILPHTDKSGALLLAERIQKYAERNAPHQPHKGKCIPGFTMSIGVASFPADGSEAEKVLNAADQAALKAKRLGKNCVCTADGK